jgi:hypothetical protein
MPTFPLHRVMQRIPRAYLRYPEREDRALHLGVYVIENLECGHAYIAYAEVDPLIARYRRCLKCETGIAVPKKPVRSVSLEELHAAQEKAA